MTACATLSPPQIWLMAVRPKSLTAAVAPVITGTTFPDAHELAERMRGVGLEDVQYALLGLGTVAIHSGVKPGLRPSCS
jgi:ubiquinone/menaquinone biosynthesis C-methylase UbiE